MILDMMISIRARSGYFKKFQNPNRRARATDLQLADINYAQISDSVELSFRCQSSLATKSSLCPKSSVCKSLILFVASLRSRICLALSFN
jgi:hypothetical protein